MKKFMFAAIAAMVMVSVSNVFASSRMVGNAEVAPVDTVAPDAPSDTTEVGTPIQPQAPPRILLSRRQLSRRQPSRRQLSRRQLSRRQLSRRQLSSRRLQRLSSRQMLNKNSIEIQ